MRTKGAGVGGRVVASRCGAFVFEFLVVGPFFVERDMCPVVWVVQRYFPAVGKCD